MLTLLLVFLSFCSPFFFEYLSPNVCLFFHGGEFYGPMVRPHEDGKYWKNYMVVVTWSNILKPMARCSI